MKLQALIHAALIPVLACAGSAVNLAALISGLACLGAAILGALISGLACAGTAVNLASWLACAGVAGLAPRLTTAAPWTARMRQEMPTAAVCGWSRKNFIMNNVLSHNGVLVMHLRWRLEQDQWSQISIVKLDDDSEQLCQARRKTDLEVYVGVAASPIAGGMKSS
ncbi:hypothetical protein C8J57DRAFT_1260850 [Mycena rebaudengoi]|nr:hypothetical protein C8J57DRAFT_1260850 [Mycena rebaudengoi]